MKKHVVLGLFMTAGIDVIKYWQIENQYWPDAYEEERKNSPWWLIRTERGLIEIGWRKRVIQINWEDTGVECIVTGDDVTKSETMVHAWSEERALEYLKVLSPLLKRGV